MSNTIKPFKHEIQKKKWDKLRKKIWLSRIFCLFSGALLCAGVVIPIMLTQCKPKKCPCPPEPTPPNPTTVYHINGDNWPGRIDGNFDGHYTINDDVVTYSSFGSLMTSYSANNLVIPDAVTDGTNVYSKFILDYFFYGGGETIANLTGTLNLGNSVIKIMSSFGGCKNLTGHLIIPDSVTEVDGFSETGFTSLTIGNHVERIGGFTSCTHLKGDLVFPDSVNEIDGFGNKYTNFEGSLTLPNNNSLILIGGHSSGGVVGTFSSITNDIGEISPNVYVMSLNSENTAKTICDTPAFTPTSRFYNGAGSNPNLSYASFTNLGGIGGQLYSIYLGHFSGSLTIPSMLTRINDDSQSGPILSFMIDCHSLIFDGFDGPPPTGVDGWYSTHGGIFSSFPENGTVSVINGTWSQADALAYAKNEQGLPSSWT